MRNSRHLRSSMGVWLTPVGNEHLTKRVEVLHALAGAEHHGIERAVRDVHGHPRLLADPLVESAQQREIGRASCRERGEIPGGAVGVKKKPLARKRARD